MAPPATLCGLPPRDTEERGIRSLLRICFPGPGALALALLTCVVLPAVLIGIHVHENYALSPQDESSEYDYVNRVAAGSVPGVEQPLLPATLRLIACHGVAAPGLALPPCGSGTLTASEFGPLGYSDEAQQPPVYYAITAGLRWIPRQLLGVSLLSATRLTGIAWLAAGLLLLWGTGRLLDVGVLPLSAGVILLGTSPGVLYQSSIVDNSASGVFAGALPLFVAALAWRRPKPWTPPVLGLSALVTCGLYLTSALGFLALAVVFLLLAVSDRGGAERAGRAGRRAARALANPWVLRAVAVSAGVVVALGGWYVAYRHLPLYDLQMRPSAGLLREYGAPSLGVFLTQGLNLLQPLTQTATGAAYRATSAGAIAGPPLSQNLQVVMSTLLELLLIAGALAWLFVRPRLWSHWAGMVSLPVLYLGGLATGLLEWQLLHTYPTLANRYGLSVTPLLVLGLVGSLRGRGAKAAVGAFGACQAGLAFYFLLA